MLGPSHRSFAWLSHDILSRLLVIDLQAGKFRTIPAMKYRPAVQWDPAHKGVTSQNALVWRIGAEHFMWDFSFYLAHMNVFGKEYGTCV